MLSLYANLTNHTGGEGRADSCAEELGKVKEAAEKRELLIIFKYNWIVGCRKSWRYSKTFGSWAAAKVGVSRKQLELD